MLLSEERLSGTFITDGFHLPKEFVKVALRAKGIERFIVVSDVVYIGGFKPGDYEFHGINVQLESNGHLHCRDSALLAGSSFTMLECMNYLSSMGELDDDSLYKACYENPLKLIRKDKEELKFNNVNRLILKDNTFQVQEK